MVESINREGEAEKQSQKTKALIAVIVVKSIFDKKITVRCLSRMPTTGVSPFLALTSLSSSDTEHALVVMGCLDLSFMQLNLFS